MADVWDLLHTLTGGQTTGTVLGPQAALGPAAPLAGPLLAPAMQGLAQWANVPGPPQSLGDVMDRLGQVYQRGNTLGTAAGTLAFLPFLAREYQIANSRNFAGNQVPGVSGMAANLLAAPSLLPGGQQAMEALGVPPPVPGLTHGDILGAAYAPAAAQGGGLAGLGAALEKIAEMQHATPEVIPLQKFATENVLNPLTFLPGARGVQEMGGPAGALVGIPARGAEMAFQLPVQGVQAAFQTPLAQRLGGQALSDFSKGRLESQFVQDKLRGLQQWLDVQQAKTPEILGTEARDPRQQAASVGAMVSAPEAEDPMLAAKMAAQAAETANAAQEALRAQMRGAAPEAAGAVPAAGPGAAEAAAAVPGVEAVPATGTLSLDLPAPDGEHLLRWFNNRAEATYKKAQAAFQALTGKPSPPATDVPLASLRAQLDPRDQSESWLASVLGSIEREGVRSGEVVPTTAAAARRASYARGLGGAVGGQTSARTGELVYTPDTIGQVDFAVQRLQGRGVLPKDDATRYAIDLRWAEDVYGDTFPAPPTGEQPLWAAIQLHVDRLAGKTPEAPGAPLPRDLGAPAPGEAPVPPAEGLPSPAPPAAGAVPDLTVPEAAPAPGRPPVPEAGPPVVEPGVAPPPAGGAPALATAPPEQVKSVADLAQGLRTPTGSPGIAVEPLFAHGTQSEIPGVRQAVYRDAAGQPVGIARAQEGFTTPSGYRYDPVIEVAVDPAYQRQGIATNLYEALQQSGFDVEAATGRGGYSEAGAAFANARAVRGAGAPPAVPPVADAAVLQAQEEALGQALRALPETAPGVPNGPRDAIMAAIAGVRQQRRPPPTAPGEIPPGTVPEFSGVPPAEYPGAPSIMPEGPLGGMADVPPAPFEAGTTMRQNPAAAQELADALKSRDVIMRESQDPVERVAANQRVAAAQAGAQADLGAGLPQDLGIAGLRQPQVDAYRAWAQANLPPGEQERLFGHFQRIGGLMPKFNENLASMYALRDEAGLGPTATTKQVIEALQKQGSEGVGIARQIQKDWSGDALTGDFNHLIVEKELPAWGKALGIDLEKAGGHPLVASLTSAWRALALLSPAFHVKNVLDSVIKTYVDAGTPGFLADARPWNPRELGGLIKTAWQETSGQATDSAISPALRVWGQIHDLPVYNDMFAAKNPTLDAALAALPESERAAVMAGLSPAERALMKVDPRLAVPTSIAEAAGPVAPGGVLAHVPGLNRLLAFNLKLTVGMEQSARQAQFIDKYAEGIAQGLPKYEAYRQGIAEANRLFFDYQGNLSNLDMLLKNVMSFHIFSTRNLNYWAPILASNPILIKALHGYDEWTNQMAEEGGYAANRRFAESMKIPLVGGVGGTIAQMLFSRQGQLFWNPTAYFGIAEQMLSTPQEYRDEPLPGQVLSKARTVGLGLAPWVDVPLQTLGAYGARGPQSVTSLDSLIESGAQTALGRPVELPWKTVQRARFPSGQDAPAGQDVPVRQRLRQMALERRPDFAAASPGQPVAPEYVQAMLEGPNNALYQEAARQLGWERFAGTLVGKVVGGGPAFQSQTEADIARAQGNPPREGTPQDRARYQMQRLQQLPPEQVPLITSGREAAVKNVNEPGSQPSGEPAETKAAYLARNWRGMSPARQMALLQLAQTDHEWRDAIAKHLGSRMVVPR